MTIDPIVALPAIASAAVLYSVSIEAAFFRIYLPVLLLLPDTYLWGWPPMNFHQWAILPIGLVMLWWVVNGRWKGSWLDVWRFFGFILWTIVSDLHANGASDIVNRVVTPVTLTAFPYMAGRLLIEQTGLRVAVARRFAFFLFIVSLISVTEFRLGLNLFRTLFSRFFSAVDPWGGVQVRYGVGRASGPYGHSIFMGALVAIAILLHMWAMHFGFWERRFRWFPRVRLLNKPRIMLWGLIAGSIMTVSRGPWIAAVVGGVDCRYRNGRATDGERSHARSCCWWLAGALVYLAGKAYVAGATTAAAQEEVASAEYRTELLNEYRLIAMQQKVWGWGSPSWPRIPGMISIDNYYLLVTLMFGVTGLVLFLLCVSAATARLLWAGMFDPDLPADQRALLFTMSGVIVAVSVAIATVYLGAQLYPILFLFLDGARLVW